MRPGQGKLMRPLVQVKYFLLGSFNFKATQDISKSGAFAQLIQPREGN